MMEMREWTSTNVRGSNLKLEGNLADCGSAMLERHDLRKGTLLRGNTMRI
jgi:hypothetical protein